MGPEGSNLKFSENQNDFWVLDKKHYAKTGYFVDIGAGDGVTGSNTYTLEKFYNWQGLCVDPNPSFLKSLCGSRDVLISDLAVWNVSGDVLDFSYLSQDRKEFFGWNFRAGVTDKINKTSVNFDKHKVFSITLNDLLNLYSAPNKIDYISIDAEGSETNILEAFDFTKYDVDLFTIEYNDAVNRSIVHNIMTNNGYDAVDIDDSGEDRFIKNRRE